LSHGSVNGEVYTDNLSIESGGKFMGLTNPAEDTQDKMLSHQEEQEEAKLLGNNDSTI